MGKRDGPLTALLGPFICLALCWCLASSCGQPPPLSELERLLQKSWQSYCRSYLTHDGRVVLKDRDWESISEAQAYALLRAVWAGDEETFGRVYGWTRTHLSREKSHGDRLLAWRWGKKGGDAWGVLDANTASDADLDYALALWLAHRRGWRAPHGLPAYETEARQVAADILAREVVALPTNEVLLAPGNWHEAASPFLINVSYFSPAAYRLFAQNKWGVAWNLLHSMVYPFLEPLSRNLYATPGVGLFPDWVQVEATGLFRPFPGRDTHFGWEAVRLPWRVALDALWFREERAVKLLQQTVLPFSKKEWAVRGKLLAVYGYDGQPQVTYESPVFYAGVLAAALAAGDDDFARQMARKVLTFYREKGGEAYFESPDNYYANNWAWFGLALYAGWVKMY